MTQRRLAGNVFSSSLSCMQRSLVPEVCSTSGRQFSALSGHAAPCMRALESQGMLQQWAQARGNFPTAACSWSATRGFAASPVGKQMRSKASAAEMGMYGATGYGGTVAGADTVEEKLKRRMENPNAELEKAAANRDITVWFNSDVADDMPWEFKPTQQYVRVKAGQSTLAFFTAHNKSDKPVTGYSVYNVTPDKLGQYFNKIQCFCFEEQRLQPHETVDMPVFFYIDSEMVGDWNCRNVDDVTLSYKFHKVDDEDLEDEEESEPAAPGSGIKLHGPGMIPPQSQQQPAPAA
ncbi:cytochrome c oxidase assembly protein CtaG/Cox11-domain-containing protein [Dunaliella salina]|uniref:Cytochrome c oxidase assembly protein CtaG/Cox11-domain-containing protein n=1 Tax=Dunaliella salina TaxID=3046 RepID=A0ABQ7GEG0_DUNSA|nr:cytochrome c oxidase assembly protein CtaG/Cox11-domain-containing protein [Dunaliella salina]|eukprot:KAF5832993.1 cytochrome c oxidase assembly protein CtaG/Cox11-domain-containing protein [Dunaliella salina]